VPAGRQPGRCRGPQGHQGRRRPDTALEGKITVTDGPFTETKEVIGGWAILQADSRAEALRIATEFMELHRAHWPEFEGESELRPMFEPGEGP